MEQEIPQDILQSANVATLEIIPKNSAPRYEHEYSLFNDWCYKKNVNTWNKEEVYLAYFAEISEKFKPSTIWSRYSMLKTMIKLKRNVDISKFYKVIAFIKQKNTGFKPKKSKILTKEDIAKFLSEAPDNIYLLYKIVAIFGIAGACRRQELTNLTLDDIEDKKDILVVKIPDTKTHVTRTFVVSGESYIYYFRKYMELRPSNTSHRRFFVNYQNGKCTVQCVGINKIGKIPSDIAGFLKLQNPEQFTGHCFRRSSATLLANSSGTDIIDLKRHGGWKSSSVAESYIEESETHKLEIANKILTDNVSKTNTINLVEPASCLQPAATTTTSSDTISSAVSAVPSCSNRLFDLTSTLNVQNMTNCTFNIHYHK